MASATSKGSSTSSSSQMQTTTQHNSHHHHHHAHHDQVLESLGGSLEGLNLSHSGGHTYWGAPQSSSSTPGFMAQPGAGQLVNGGSHLSNVNHHTDRNSRSSNHNDGMPFQDNQHHNNKPLQPLISSPSHPSTTKSTPTSANNSSAARKRGESIDIFLSTSPSQLDSGFLKFRNNDGDAIPPLSLDAQQQHQQQSSVNNLAPPPGMNNTNKNSATNNTSNSITKIKKSLQRDDCSRSPSCSVTGTSISSRSVSPTYSSSVVTDGGRRTMGNVPAPVLPLTSSHSHSHTHNPHHHSSDGGGIGAGHRGVPHSNLNQASSGGYVGNGGDFVGNRAHFASSSGYNQGRGAPSASNPTNTFDALGKGGGDYGNPYAYGADTTGREHHSHHPGFPTHQQIGSGGPNTINLHSHHHPQRPQQSQQPQRRRDDFSNAMAPTNTNPNTNVLTLPSQNTPNPHPHGVTTQTEPNNNNTNTNPQPQIFYMAVPTPDGQGQVLQPIQMVQLPGQPNAFVLPVGAQAQNIVAVHGGAGGVQQPHVGAGGRMMVAQPGTLGNNVNGSNVHGAEIDHQYSNTQAQVCGQKKNHRGGQRNNTSSGGRHSNAAQFAQAHRSNGGSKAGGSAVVGNHGALPYGKQYYPQSSGGVNVSGSGSVHNTVDSRMAVMGKQPYIDATRPSSSYSQHSNNHSIVSKGYGENTYREQQGDVTITGRDDFSVTSLHDSSSSNHPTNANRDITSSSSNSLNSKNDFVASLYASPQRPPLQDLLGHVRRLSRDQVGCRLLQQSLDEEEGTDAATLILNEGLSFWGEAMVDPFGNYLFQKILEKISAEERIVLVKSVSARLVNASLNLHGTRSVQKVVELCAVDEAAANPGTPGTKPATETAAEILSRALSPAAARLCIDSHGNHVIQRILLKLPYRYSHFVFNAVATSVGDVARHRHGCCVIQRCLDSSPSAARSNLVQRIVEKSLELMQDAYGNYVVQYVLDVCSDEDVHSVCESVVGRVNLLAIQKFSSNVMEKCLDRCTDRVREVYLTELSDSERIRELMMDPFGNYVIQRALAVATHAQAVKLVDAMKPHLTSSTGNNGGIRNTAGGRRIITKICRRFPNFNVGDGVLTMGVGAGEKEHGRGGGGGGGQTFPESTNRQDSTFMRRRGGGGGGAQMNNGNHYGQNHSNSNRMHHNS